MTPQILRVAELLLFALIAAFGIISARQLAAASKGKSSSSAQRQDVSDKNFLDQVAREAAAEVKLGKLGEDKAQTPAVKDLGKHIAEDGGKAEGKLQEAAALKNVQLPKAPSTEDLAAYSRVSKLSGRAFDRAYARLVVAEESRDVAAFRREIKRGKNARVKSFVSRALPALQERLAEARRAYQKVNAGNAGAAHPSSPGTGR